MGHGHEHKPLRHPEPGHKTGVPIIDEGPLCERDPKAEGCFLNERDRTRLLGRLDFEVGQAMLNYQTAIQNVRIDVLTDEGAPGWGLLAEFIFQSVSGGLIGRLNRSLQALKKQAILNVFDKVPSSIGGMELSHMATQRLANLNTEAVKGLMVNASRSLRTQLKNAANHGNSKDEHGAADFLRTFQNGTAPMARQLTEEAPVEMSDDQLSATVEAFKDQSLHSVAAYEAELRDLIERFKKQHIGEIGKPISHGATTNMGELLGPAGVTDDKEAKGYTQAVRVIAGGKSRIAVVRTFNSKFNDVYGPKMHENRTMAPNDQMEFVSFVDSGLEDAASEFQQSRMGAMPVIDASKVTGMGEIDRWAKDSARQAKEIYGPIHQHFVGKEQTRP